MALATSGKASTKAGNSKLPALPDSKPAEPSKTTAAKATPGKPMAAATPATAPKPAPVRPRRAKQRSHLWLQRTNPQRRHLRRRPVRQSPVIGAAATDSAKGKPHFTLQLSSFQDRGEAEAFAAKFGSEKTYLVVSEIPGKGTWYRVRVGDFATAKDAIAGKLAFEKKHGVIAYVAQR